jgi:DNA-binding CsgD family transcriptional regulator
MGGTVAKMPKLRRGAQRRGVKVHLVGGQLVITVPTRTIVELAPVAAVGEDLRLSPREQQTLNLILRSASNKEIARALFITERTVKYHVSNILDKFGVASRRDLLLMARMKQATPKSETEKGETC